MNQEITSATLKKLLSQKLTLLREKSGETIEETAFDLGLDTSDYFKFLKGQRLPHLLTLIRFGQKYGVSLGWWFTELDKDHLDKTQTKNSSLELRIARIIGRLDERLQKAALAMLKASVKSLVSVSR
jgi:transcriptional regulator with XRE-family HTH domain